MWEDSISIFEREFKFTVTEAAVVGVGYMALRYHWRLAAKAPMPPLQRKGRAAARVIAAALRPSVGGPLGGPNQWQPVGGTGRLAGHVAAGLGRAKALGGQ